jgi:cell division protein FtsB
VYRGHGGGLGTEGGSGVSRLPHLPLTPLVVGAAALAITYLGFTTTRYVVHEYNLREEQARLHREINQLDRDHAQLVAVRDYLKSDEYIEDVARRVLGFVRPGETLVVVSSSAPEPAAMAPAATPGPVRTPAAAWWKDLFVQPAPLPTPAPSAVVP